MEIISFEINKLPPMYNVYLRMHFRKRTELNNEFFWLMKGALPVVYHKSYLPFEKCQLYFTRFSTHEPDYDGLVGSFKLICDNLIKAQIIVDDRISLTGKWNVEWEKVSKKKDKKIRVEVRGND